MAGVVHEHVERPEVLRRWRPRTRAASGSPTLAACQATSPSRPAIDAAGLGECVGLARRQHHVGSGLGEARRRWPGRCLVTPPSPVPPCRRVAGPWRHTLRRPAPAPGHRRRPAVGIGPAGTGRGWAVAGAGAVGSRAMNRLASETSPYLRQHAHNPVDWYPWGDEAFARARAEDRPVFLSVGYSACHWCHVMAHESFEDDADRRSSTPASSRSRWTARSDPTSTPSTWRPCRP